MQDAVRGAKIAEGVPIVAEKLALGAWQGVYLWEHRRRGSRRSVVLHIGT